MALAALTLMKTWERQPVFIEQLYWCLLHSTPHVLLAHASHTDLTIMLKIRAEARDRCLPACAALLGPRKIVAAGAETLRS